MANKQPKRKTVELIKGYNKKLDNIEYATENIIKPPGYENASGFYTFDRNRQENIKIALAYADAVVEETGEGHPTISYYVLDLSTAVEDITAAYYDSLNPESIHYVGDNINSLFPEWCRWYNNNKDIKPVDVCHSCPSYDCERNADYIESILSDGKDEYNLDSILTKLVFNEIDDNEALRQINELLQENNVNVKIQITLRPKVMKYLHFITSKTKEEVLRDGE